MFELNMLHLSGDTLNTANKIIPVFHIKWSASKQLVNKSSICNSSWCGNKNHRLIVLVMMTQTQANRLTEDKALTTDDRLVVEGAKVNSGKILKPATITAAADAALSIRH